MVSYGCEQFLSSELWNLFRFRVIFDLLIASLNNVLLIQSVGWLLLGRVTFLPYSFHFFNSGTLWDVKKIYAQTLIYTFPELFPNKLMQGTVYLRCGVFCFKPVHYFTVITMDTELIFVTIKIKVIWFNLRCLISWLYWGLLPHRHTVTPGTFIHLQ